jgi:tetratricopeptide (TPR) repeat protein
MRDCHDEAIELCGSAVQRAPSDNRLRCYLGALHNYRGNSEQAERYLAEAAQSCPHMDSWMVYFSVLAKLWAGDLKTALALAERYVVMEPTEPYGQLYLAVIQETLGNSQDAAATIKRLRETCPAFGTDNIKRSQR